MASKKLIDLKPGDRVDYRGMVRAVATVKLYGNGIGEIRFLDGVRATSSTDTRFEVEDPRVKLAEKHAQHIKPGEAIRTASGRVIIVRDVTLFASGRTQFTFHGQRGVLLVDDEATFEIVPLQVNVWDADTLGDGTYTGSRWYAIIDGAAPSVGEAIIARGEVDERHPLYGTEDEWLDGAEAVAFLATAHADTKGR